MKLLTTVCIATSLALTACATSSNNGLAIPSETINHVADDINTDQQSNWAGTYQGVLPCADCAGIATTLTINNNLTYSLTQRYLDKNTEDEVKGTFVWDDQGEMITLDTNGDSRQYVIKEGTAIQLYMDGSLPTGPLASHYLLKKLSFID